MVFPNGEDFDDDLGKFLNIFHFLRFLKYLMFLVFKHITCVIVADAGKAHPPGMSPLH